MKLRPALLVLWLGFSVFAQSVPEDSAPALPYIDPDAYGVYSAIIPTLPLYQAAKTVIIKGETAPTNDLGPPRGCLHGDKQFQDEYAQVFADYEQANRSEWLLDPNFDLDKPFDLISKIQFAAFADRGNGPAAVDPWEGFYRRHPDSGGYIVLSAVGFNAEKAAAVVYVGYKCAADCGSGRYYVLEKNQGDWQEVQLIEPSCSSTHG